MFRDGCSSKARSYIAPRIDGNFTGTTAEILRWTACKWGIDESIVFAQTVMETWWRQTALGDWHADAGACPPGHGLGADGKAGRCPQSYGLLGSRRSSPKGVDPEGLPGALRPGGDNGRVPEPLLTLTAVPFVPEIRLWLADETTGLWDATGGGYRTDQPPPFWAFAWAGGVGLARFVLDHPTAVRGLRVLDLGAGSGIVAIAAARAGAAAVVAADTDPDAEPAIHRNAVANDVLVAVQVGDPLLDDAVDTDVMLIGDMFYSPPIVNRLMRYLRRAQAANPSIRILASDPNRGYLTPDRFEELAAYQVPVRPALEETSSMTATVWQLRPRPH